MTPTFGDMLRVFGRVGVLSFGGPAAQIALMHRVLVEERPWLSEQQFLRALSFCMLLPGPEAMQLATYAGWRQRGIVGGLLAGGLFVIPGAIVIMALALAYGVYGDLAWMQALFLGVQAAVVVIVIGALRKVMAKALHGRKAIGIALAAFVALCAFQIPFPVVILVAALIGAMTRAPKDAETSPPLDMKNSLYVIVIGAVIWSVPIGIAWLMGSTFLVEIGLFFSKLAVVTFGGAYSVLAYMTQTVVADHGWISTAQMMDALGLAETTPGPLILVTQFVGMIAGLAQGGGVMAFLAGLLTLWVTFVPCFIWIFAGAPLIDWLAGQPRLQAALHGITAAVVGVIANLAVWFALHVFFATVTDTSVGPALLALPDVTTIQPVPVLLAIVAAILMFWRNMDLLLTLLICAVLGIGLHIIGLA